MKKTGIIGLILLVSALLIVGVAVPALGHGADNDGTIRGTGTHLGIPTLTRLAETLGITPEELTDHLQDGETLAEIAAEQGVSEELLIEAIVAPHAEQLDLQVKYGYLNQSQADELLETARERAAWLLEQDLSASTGYDSWEDMEEYCGNAMGGWGGMMGGMMHNGWGGMMDGFRGMGGGMMGGW